MYQLVVKALRREDRGNLYVSQSSAGKFLLFPKKNKETKVLHIALENHGKLISRKLNICNTFILLVDLTITSLPRTVILSEKWMSWKYDMHLLHVIDYHYPDPDKPKPSCFNNCSFFFFPSATYGDHQECQNLLAHSAADGRGNCKFMLSFLP